MSARRLIHEEGLLSLGFSVPLQAVGVYQDSQALARIHRLQEHLAAELAGGFRFDACDWFAFDELGDPILSRQAASAASAADLILFSADGDSELPPQLTHWMEDWITRERTRDAALVALLVHACEESWKTSLRSYLRQVSGRGGIEFFALSTQSTA